MSMNIVPAGGGGGGGGSVSIAAPYIISGATKYGPIVELVDPSLPAWSWVNQGTATITSVNGAQVLTALSSAGAVDLKMRVLTLPVAPFTITVGMQSTVQGANFTRTGIGLRESATSKVASINSTTANLVSVDYWTNSTTYGSTPVNITLPTVTDFKFFRVAKSGTTLTFSYSVDGNYFMQAHSVVQTTPFTTAPDQFCLMVNSNSSTPLSATYLSYVAS